MDGPFTLEGVRQYFQGLPTDTRSIPPVETTQQISEHTGDDKVCAPTTSGEADTSGCDPKVNHQTAAPPLHALQRSADIGRPPEMNLDKQDLADDDSKTKTSNEETVPPTTETQQFVAPTNRPPSQQSSLSRPPSATYLVPNRPPSSPSVASIVPVKLPQVPISVNFLSSSQQPNVPRSPSSQGQTIGSNGQERLSRPPSTSDDQWQTNERLSRPPSNSSDYQRQSPFSFSGTSSIEKLSRPPSNSDTSQSHLSNETIAHERLSRPPSNSSDQQSPGHDKLFRPLNSVQSPLNSSSTVERSSVPLSVGSQGQENNSRPPSNSSSHQGQTSGSVTDQNHGRSPLGSPVFQICPPQMKLSSSTVTQDRSFKSPPNDRSPLLSPVFQVKPDLNSGVSFQSQEKMPLIDSNQSQSFQDPSKSPLNSLQSFGNQIQEKMSSNNAVKDQESGGSQYQNQMETLPSSMKSPLNNTSQEKSSERLPLNKNLAFGYQNQERTHSQFSDPNSQSVSRPSSSVSYQSYQTPLGAPTISSELQQSTVNTVPTSSNYQVPTSSSQPHQTVSSATSSYHMSQSFQSTSQYEHPYQDYSSSSRRSSTEDYSNYQKYFQFSQTPRRENSSVPAKQDDSSNIQYQSKFNSSQMEVPQGFQPIRTSSDRYLPLQDCSTQNKQSTRLQEYPAQYPQGYQLLNLRTPSITQQDSRIKPSLGNNQSAKPISQELPPPRVPSSGRPSSSQDYSNFQNAKSMRQDFPHPKTPAERPPSSQDYISHSQMAQSPLSQSPRSQANQNSQILQSPHSQIAHSPHSQIARSPHSQVSQSPHSQIPQSPHSQIARSPHLQIPQSPHSQIPQSPHSQIPQSPHSQVSPSLHSQIARSPHSQVTPSPHSQIARSPHSQIAPSPHSQIAQSPHSQIARSPHSQIPQNPHSQIVQSPRPPSNSQQSRPLSYDLPPPRTSIERPPLSQDSLQKYPPSSSVSQRANVERAQEYMMQRYNLNSSNNQASRSLTQTQTSMKMERPQNYSQIAQGFQPPSNYPSQRPDKIYSEKDYSAYPQIPHGYQPSLKSSSNLLTQDKPPSSQQDYVTYPQIAQGYLPNQKVSNNYPSRPSQERSCFTQPVPHGYDPNHRIQEYQHQSKMASLEKAPSKSQTVYDSRYPRQNEIQVPHAYQNLEEKRSKTLQNYQPNSSLSHQTFPTVPKKEPQQQYGTSNYQFDKRSIQETSAIQIPQGYQPTKKSQDFNAQSRKYIDEYQLQQQKSQYGHYNKMFHSESIQHSKIVEPRTSSSSETYRQKMSTVPGQVDRESGQHPSNYLANHSSNPPQKTTHNLPPIASLSSVNYHSNKNSQKQSRMASQTSVNSQLPSSRLSDPQARLSAGQHSSVVVDPYSRMLVDHQSKSSRIDTNQTPIEQKQNRYPPNPPYAYLPGSGFENTSSHSTTQNAAKPALQETLMKRQQLQQNAATKYYPTAVVRSTNEQQSFVNNRQQTQQQTNATQQQPTAANNNHSSAQQRTVGDIKSGKPVKRESPLDLSVKTVRTPADSTADDDIQLIDSADPYYRTPTFLKNTIGIPIPQQQPTNDARQLYQAEQARRPIATTSISAPKVDFNPNFSVAQAQNATRTSYTASAAYEYKNQGVKLPYDNRNAYYPPQNTSANYPIPTNYVNQKSDSGLPKIDFPGDMARHQKETCANKITQKRPSNSPQSQIPEKIQKTEAWRQSIDRQIEQKLSSYSRAQEQMMQKQRRESDPAPIVNGHNANHAQDKSEYKHHSFQYGRLEQATQPNASQFAFRLNNTYPPANQSSQHRAGQMMQHPNSHESAQHSQYSSGHAPQSQAIAAQHPNSHAPQSHIQHHLPQSRGQPYPNSHAPQIHGPQPPNSHAAPGHGPHIASTHTSQSHVPQRPSSHASQGHTGQQSSHGHPSLSHQTSDIAAHHEYFSQNHVPTSQASNIAQNHVPTGFPQSHQTLQNVSGHAQHSYVPGNAYQNRAFENHAPVSHNAPGAVQSQASHYPPTHLQQTQAVSNHGQQYHVPSHGQYQQQASAAQQQALTVQQQQQQQTYQQQHTEYQQQSLPRTSSYPKLPQVGAIMDGPGADKRVLSILRNSLEIKGAAKQLEQQTNSNRQQQTPQQQRSSLMFQQPSTDVTTPVQPKLKQNLPQFVAAPERDSNTPPHKFHLPRAVDSVARFESDEPTEIDDPDKKSFTSGGATTVSSDYDGLAANLAARIRTKAELKQVDASQYASSIEKSVKESPQSDPNALSGTSSSTCSISPPKLTREKLPTGPNPTAPPRRRLFSRNEDDQNNVSGGPHRDSSLRSSSEVSVFDYHDTDSETEMPVLERQSLDDLRRDRKSTSTKPVAATSTPNTSATELPEKDVVIKEEPMEEEDIGETDPFFSETCDKFLEDLRTGGSSSKKRGRRKKVDIQPKIEPYIETPTLKEVEIKVEKCDSILESIKTEQLITDIKKEPCEEKLFENITPKVEPEDSDSDAPLIRKKINVVNNKKLVDSESSDDEDINMLKKRGKKGARIKLESSSSSRSSSTSSTVNSSDSSDTSSESDSDSDDYHLKNQRVTRRTKPINTRLRTRKRKASAATLPKSGVVTRTMSTPDKKRGASIVQSQDSTPPKQTTPAKNNSPRSKSANAAAVPQPTVTVVPKKQTFGDGSDFTPGWEEDLYRFKQSLRMPRQLINVSRPMRLSTSLPDLDPCPSSPAPSSITDISEVQGERRTGSILNSSRLDSDVDSNSSFSLMKRDESEETRRNFLDSLVQKCGQNINRKRGRTKTIDIKPKIIPKSNNEVELLPTPSLEPAWPSKSKPSPKKLKKSVETNERNSVRLEFRKETIENFRDAFKNQSVVKNKFDPVVFKKSRTRKETRALKQKATIREVFGEDRPASAPPMTHHSDTEMNEKDESKNADKLNKKPIIKTKECSVKVSKSEAVTKYVTRMSVSSPSKRREARVSRSGLRSAMILRGNRAVLKSKKQLLNAGRRRNCTVVITNKTLKRAVVKIEQDKRISARQNADEIKIKTEIKTEKEEEDVKSGIVPELGPPPKKKMKLKSMRRKFSSGFDYIRKKKKQVKKLEGADPCPKVKKKRGALARANAESVQDIQREIKGWVLNKGIGETHLHRAARLGYTDVCAYCLETQGHNPSPKDNAGYTPLHEACSRGHLEIAKLLLTFGADVSESAHGGIRPLHEAAENGYVEIARLLLSYGADPNLVTYSGQTPTSLAAEDAAAATLLHQHVADLTGVAVTPWRFPGPAPCFDLEETGYDVLDGAPSPDPCPADSDSGDELSIELSDIALPNLYTLRSDPDRWVLLQDLLNVLKSKSKDALLRQIAAPVASGSAQNHATKGIVRELKMAEFLEQARCCHLLSAGEKINVRASKVALVKYTERVKTLLGVEDSFIPVR